MKSSQKYNLFMDAVRIIRSLADVIEAIAETYREEDNVIEGDVKFIEVEDIKELPAEKEVSLEDVRAVLAVKSQNGLTSEVKDLIGRYGGTKLSDINPTQYKALLKDAEVLGND